MNNFFTYFIIKKIDSREVKLDMVLILRLYYISVWLDADYVDLTYNYSVKNWTLQQTELYRPD